MVSKDQVIFQRSNQMVSKVLAASSQPESFSLEKKKLNSVGSSLFNVAWIVANSFS
jgi:hypothetical protein